MALGRKPSLCFLRNLCAFVIDNVGLLSTHFNSKTTTKKPVSRSSVSSSMPVVVRSDHDDIESRNSANDTKKCAEVSEIVAVKSNLDALVT